MKQSRGKIIAVNWQTVRDALESDDICVTLKQGHVIALASVIEFLRWRTRWTNLDYNADFLSFTDDLEARLMGCGCDVDCNKVVQCIEENIEEVTELITKNQTFIDILNQQIEQAIENYNVVINPPLGGDCRARVWSASRAIVRRLHGDTLDFLEQLETYTNFNEFLAVISFLPLLDESGIDTLFQLFNYIQENVLEQYSAFYTDEVEDEIACAIFCSIECDEFTLDAVIRAYEQRASKNLSSLLNIQTYLNTLVAGGLPTNSLMVDVLHLLALGLAKLGATRILNVFQIDPRAWTRYVNSIRVGLRTEDDSYNEFCDCPPLTWSHTLNFTTSDIATIHQYCQGNSVGIWVSGTGYQTVGNLKNPSCANQLTWRVAEITIPFRLQTGVITTVELTYNASALGAGFKTVAVLLTNRTTGGTELDELLGQASPSLGTNTATFQGTWTVNKSRLKLRLWLQETSGSAEGAMRSVRVSGTGTNPF